MRREYESPNRYFPTYQSNIYVNGNSALRAGAPKSTISTDRHIESRIVYGQASQQKNCYEHPYLTSSSGISELNQRLADENNLMEYRRRSSKKKKIFDNARSTYSLNRNSRYSADSDKNWLKRSQDNFMHYNNPISSKVNSRSRSGSKQKKSHQPIFPFEKKSPLSNNIPVKGPVLFTYSNPHMKVCKPTRYEAKPTEPDSQITLRNFMKQPIIFKTTELHQNTYEQSKSVQNSQFHTFAPYQEVEIKEQKCIKKNYHQNDSLLQAQSPKISLEKINNPSEKNYEQDSDRFFDMDFKPNSLEKEQTEESNEHFLSPLKAMPEIQSVKANHITELTNKIKKLYGEADGQGKFLSAVLIILGILLVLFQASK